MAELQQPESLAQHLGHLAADADDIKELLTRRHHEGGDIHPEALGKADRLATGLRDVIGALGEHEHLAMTADDVWAALSIRHRSRGDGTIS
jgi:hypothetical protein